jgi:tRNA pseudouridine38-40 synthase
MAENIALTLEYDGTDYFGWQIQSQESTIQGVLQKAIEKLTGERVHLAASGRTDSGVHALGQVANFKTEADLRPDEILRALNSLLPRDIAVKRAEAMAEDFHAQYSARLKSYKYVVLNRPVPSPLLRRFSWHVRYPLKIPPMQEAALYLVGTHNFSAFRRAEGDDERNPTRTVSQLTVGQTGDTVEIRIEADGFLRFMVRSIAGALVEVGKGKMKPLRVKEILDSKDRKKAPPTAPARGLFLVEVQY